MFFHRLTAKLQVRRERFLLFLITIALVPGAPVRAADDYKSREVLVRLQPRSNVAQFNEAFGTQTDDQIPGVPVLRLRTRPGVDPETLRANMRQDPRVVWAEPNYLLNTVENLPQQWIAIFDGGVIPGLYLNQSALLQVNFGLAAGWSQGSGVTVAILDTGISTRSPLLAGKSVVGWNALDGSAQTDDVPNFVDDNGNGAVDEATGHGTMVAGVVAQCAPGASLIPVKVLDSDGVGDVWSLVKGIRWAVDQGARVLNLSLGIRRYSALLAEAVEESGARGAIIVTSAGNNNTEQPQYPAGLPRALTVAALNPDNTKAAFSNFGERVDVCAPGVHILSAYWDGRSGAGTGTSFAAPFVTAQAALIWSLAPGLSGTSVQELIGNTARNVDLVNPFHRNRLGHGLIDFDTAILSLLAP
jgi:subtilisin family serine protease